MATRPRTSTSRTKKTTSPAVATVDAQASQVQRAANAADAQERATSRRGAEHAGAGPATTERTAAGQAEITTTRLERREIPSFSISREARIAEAAYWRAERRGFAGGQELDDWLAAEIEIDGEIAAGLPGDASGPEG